MRLQWRAARLAESSVELWGSAPTMRTQPPGAASEASVLGDPSERRGRPPATRCELANWAPLDATIFRFRARPAGASDRAVRDDLASSTSAPQIVARGRNDSQIPARRKHQGVDRLMGRWPGLAVDEQTKAKPRDQHANRGRLRMPRQEGAMRKPSARSGPWRQQSITRWPADRAGRGGVSERFGTEARRSSAQRSVGRRRTGRRAGAGLRGHGAPARVLERRRPSRAGGGGFRPADAR